jgi:murein DD-endopeptidase MepM/ murein hydrolase activator NlpD
MNRPLRLAPLALLLIALPLTAGEVHILRKGETLYRVARTYDVPVQVLQVYNHIENPQLLREGTEIRIPERHRVVKGDTLYGLSRRYGLDLDELLRLNGISPRELLKVGAVLYLPDRTAEGTAVAREAGGGRGTASAEGPPPGGEGAPPSGGPRAAAGDQGQGAFYWPHPGRRELLQGRFTGAIIYGEAGDSVCSVSAGRVVWCGPFRGYSRVILIEAQNGYIYLYAGNEETLVAVGDAVLPGSEIGRLGKSVHEGVPQLYFSVYRSGEPVDPSTAPRT